MDRQQNGARRLRESGIKNYSVTSIREFLEILLDNGLMPKLEYDGIVKYLEGFKYVEE